MRYQERISSDPDVMLGKPVITGTRITVELILTKLSEGMSLEDFLEGYPHITKEDILSALAYSADMMKNEEQLAS